MADQNKQRTPQHPNINFAKRQDQQITVQNAVDTDPLSAVRQATGLNITESDLKSMEDEERALREAPKGARALTPAEMAQLEDDFVRVDVEKELEVAEAQKIAKHAQDQINSINDLFSEADEAEKERDERFEEALKNPEIREELKSPEQKKNESKVTYNPDMAESDDDKFVQRRAQFQVDENERTGIDTEAPTEDDLMPAYDDEDDVVPVATDNEAEEQARPKPEQSDEEQAEYIKNLKTVSTGDDDDFDINVVNVKREQIKVTPVTERAANYKVGGDQAFINAMNRYKRDNFRVTTVALVNSGFSVDIVGTAPMDLTLLYAAVDENTSQADYEIEKMKTIIRNVVAANPKVKSENLRNMIHFADYQLMAYAHVVGTLKDVELIHTCNDCGKDFHIVAKSSDLVLNLDKMKEKIQQVRAATTAGENSLLAKDEKLEFESGSHVILGHPSYHEYIRHLEELRSTLRKIPSTESTRLTALIQILPYIRSVELPSGMRTSNLYQRYLAVTMLNEDEYSEVVERVQKMRDQIITPEFGIKRVRCPHCGKINSDIRYSDLTDLVFFHTTVSRLLKQTVR